MCVLNFYVQYRCAPYVSISQHLSINLAVCTTETQVFQKPPKPRRRSGHRSSLLSCGLLLRVRYFV